jgi:hypothetical protein
MELEPALETRCDNPCAAALTAGSCPAQTQAVAPAKSNLAALLDQFTATISNPQSHTVGTFAQTVEALHGELTMLARHFGAEAYSSEDVGFDLHDGENYTVGTDEQPIEPGIAAAEELEHLCRELSR